jgi:hypothetical protein
VCVADVGLLELGERLGQELGVGGERRLGGGGPGAPASGIVKVSAVLEAPMLATAM